VKWDWSTTTQQVSLSHIREGVYRWRWFIFSSTSKKRGLCACLPKCGFPCTQPPHHQLFFSPYKEGVIPLKQSTVFFYIYFTTFKKTEREVGGSGPVVCREMNGFQSLNTLRREGKKKREAFFVYITQRAQNKGNVYTFISHKRVLLGCGAIVLFSFTEGGFFGLSLLLTSPRPSWLANWLALGGGPLWRLLCD